MLNVLETSLNKCANITYLDGPEVNISPARLSDSNVSTTSLEQTTELFSCMPFVD